MTAQDPWTQKDRDAVDIRVHVESVLGPAPAVNVSAAPSKRVTATIVLTLLVLAVVLATQTDTPDHVPSDPPPSRR